MVEYLYDNDGDSFVKVDNAAFYERFYREMEEWEKELKEGIIIEEDVNLDLPW